MLRVKWIRPKLTFGQVWDIVRQNNEPIVRRVIVVAQGEMALEDNLNKFRIELESYELTQDERQLIGNWDSLFKKHKKNLSFLAAIKKSPYHKVFEKEYLKCEDQIFKIDSFFNLLNDFQSQYLKLEKVFSGNASIKALLPKATRLFREMGANYLCLMKEISVTLKVMDVLEKTCDVVVGQHPSTV